MDMCGITDNFGIYFWNTESVFTLLLAIPNFLSYIGHIARGHFIEW